MLWNEAASRTTVFLTVLSAAMVAPALLADATGFGSQTTTVALAVLPVVLFLGVATHRASKATQSLSTASERPG